MIDQGAGKTADLINPLPTMERRKDVFTTATVHIKALGVYFDAPLSA